MALVLHKLETNQEQSLPTLVIPVITIMQRHKSSAHLTSVTVKQVYFKVNVIF